MPKALYFDNYETGILWLAERRFPGNIYRRRFLSCLPRKIIDEKEHSKETLFFFTQKKYPPKEVDRAVEIDINRGGVKMFTTSPTQKRYYFRGWMKEGSQYTQGDFFGGPFEDIVNEITCMDYYRVSFSYLNHFNQRCGMTTVVAEDDPSLFFIAIMKNNDKNKKTGILYSHHFYRKKIDDRYDTFSLKTLKKTKKEFFSYMQSEILEQKFENLFIENQNKISINLPLLKDEIQPNLTMVTVNDIPWVQRPSKSEIAQHYAKSIAKSATTGAAIGFSVGFLLGLATLGTGFIVCVVVCTVLGIVDGMDYASRNPPAKITLFSQNQEATTPGEIPQTLTPSPSPLAKNAPGEGNI